MNPPPPAAPDTTPQPTSDTTKISRGVQRDVILVWASRIVRASIVVGYGAAILVVMLTAAGLVAHVRGEPIALAGLLVLDPETPWPVMVFRGGLGAAYLGGFILIMRQLRGLIVTVHDGDPFVGENALRLRTVWLTVAGLELGRYGLGVVWAGLVALDDGPAAGAIISQTLEINLRAWFAVLVLVIIAEVFRHGTQLREEQKLTI